MNRKKEITELKEKVSKLADSNQALKEKIESIVSVLKKSDILEDSDGAKYYHKTGQYKAIWDIGGISRINDKREHILFKLIETLGYEYKEELTPYVPETPSQYVTKIVKKGTKK